MINRRITASSWPKHPVLTTVRKTVSHSRERASVAPHDQCIAWKPDVASRVRYAGLTPALDPLAFAAPVTTTGAVTGHLTRSIHISGLRQTDCILFSFARARVTFAKMSEALAVQMNGFGSRLCFSTYCSIAQTNSGTERKTARRNWFSDRSRKKRSTMLSQEALVGVKCMRNRGCLASHAFTSGCLWVA